MEQVRTETQTSSSLTRAQEHTPEAQGDEGQDRSPFVNREISWLRFNERVLDQAQDPDTPLLQRVFYLSIFASNLDEFFMKRVGGLRRHIATGLTPTSPDGYTPHEQVKLIRDFVLPLLDRAEEVYLDDLKPSLEAQGVHIVEYSDLSDDEVEFARYYFEKSLFPRLTPLAVDAGHPFPLLSNLSLSLGVALKHPDREDPLFARVKVSGLAPQWLHLPNQDEEKTYRLLNVQEIVLHNLQDLFPNMQILAAMPFRVTRNADLDVDEEDSEDLLSLIEENLRQRRFARVVRLEHGPDPDPWILRFLVEELDLEEGDVYEHEALIDFSTISELCALPIPALKNVPWSPVAPSGFSEEHSVFSTLRTNDVLVHHPFESFAKSVGRFVSEAADDPKVLSIKMTVYRVGDETPIIPSLIRAAENGKQVIVLVELKARFEEERNIHWAHKLDDAGIHVVYGIPGLKIHAKTIIVVRDEPDGIRTYSHMGTGNYHSKTSNLYTDLGLFSSREEHNRDLMDLFNYLTGRSLKDDYRSILVSPVTMEETYLRLIDDEIENAQKGKPAQIIAKMNALEDRHMINALYAASQAGVKIDLVVRGICCLRPGVKGLSENITVRSIVGRLLEHSRIFYFRSGADEPLKGKFFIASADWMGRNLHRRVELAVPITENIYCERVWQILQLVLEDRKQSWQMNSDGSYSRMSTREERSDLECSQYKLMQLAKS